MDAINPKPKDTETGSPGEFKYLLGTLRESLEFGIGAVDASAMGIRCQAACEIASQQGNIKARAKGTIVYELIGRSFHLINVYWDHGADTYASPREVIISDANIVWS